MGHVSSYYEDDAPFGADERPGFSWEQEDARAAERVKRPFTVTGALGLAQKALQDVNVRLVGEVSDVSNKAGYKAVYFSVKDEKSVLSCMMWNNRYKSQGIELEVGMKVELSGRFTLYAARGTMNFEVFSIKLTGEGEIRLQMARMAAKLAAEGLTAQERKRPLPAFPEVIGLVTSPRGATVHDVLRTLRNRYPAARVAFAGVPVEGPGAAAEMIRGINCVCRAGAEVVLLIRGGGPIESLMPFNDEGLARAIAACPVPLVTGIGHETDTTVADLVSDLRTLTPTAAATAASPDSANLKLQLSETGNRMYGSLSRRLERSKLYLDRYAEKPVLRDASSLISPVAMELDSLQERLGAALPNRMREDSLQLERLSLRLRSNLGHALDSPLQQRQQLEDRLRSAGPRLVQVRRQEMALAAAQLEALSPVAVLSRGYAIARTGQGAIISSVSQVNVGDDLNVRVSDGSITAKVSAAE